MSRYMFYIHYHITVNYVWIHRGTIEKLLVPSSSLVVAVARLERSGGRRTGETCHGRSWNSADSAWRSAIDTWGRPCHGSELTWGHGGKCWCNFELQLWIIFYGFRHKFKILKVSIFIYQNSLVWLLQFLRNHNWPPQGFVAAPFGWEIYLWIHSLTVRDHHLSTGSRDSNKTSGRIVMGGHTR